MRLAESKLIRASAHHMPMITDGSIHMIATSPPYYGLRSYQGEQDVDWPEVRYSPMAGLVELVIPPWRGPLGLEPTVEMYVGHIVLCAREWWRVLRKDSTLWLNLGSSFSSGIIKSDTCVLRNDLTSDEVAYVLRELAIYVEKTNSMP